MKDDFLIKLKSSAEIVLRSIYPRRCIICRRILPLTLEEYLCGECHNKIEWISGSVCESCGKPIPAYGRCRSCNSMRIYYDKGYAVYVYKDEMRDAIHRFKYGGKGGFARFFGREMALFADLEDIPLTDLIVPVPIHSERQRKRGYNQSELLADIYCSIRGSESVRLLKRVKKTKPQSGLKKEDRIKNVRGVFAINDCGIDIKGKSVLLIDDIYTTGSTVNECARVLKRAGAKSVYVFCLSISEVD